MSSSPRAEPSTPRRLGIGALLRQRLSPCLPGHLAACLPFLKKSRAQHSAQAEYGYLQPNSPDPPAEAAEKPPPPEPPNCLTTTPAHASAPTGATDAKDSSTAEKDGDTSTAKAANSYSFLPVEGSATARSLHGPLPQQPPSEVAVLQQLEELQRAIAKWSTNLVAAQAAAATELRQLLRRAEAAALLQNTEVSVKDNST